MTGMSYSDFPKSTFTKQEPCKKTKCPTCGREYHAYDVKTKIACSARCRIGLMCIERDGKDT